MSGTPTQVRRGRLRSVPFPRGGVIALVCVLIGAVLATGAWFGDIALRQAAQSQVAGHLQTQLGTSEKPAVTFQGWPFISQAAERRFREVTVDASNARPSGVDLTLDSVHAVGQDVSVSPDQSTVTIGSLTGDVRVSYAEVSRVAGREVSFAAPDRVQLQLIPDVLEQSVPVVVTGRPALQPDRTVSLVDAEIEVIGVEIPPEVSQQIIDKYGSIPLNLPGELTPTTVTATEAGLGVAFTGEQIVVRR